MGELHMKARVGEILNRHAAVGLAVGVVRSGQLEFFCGHGVADIVSNATVTEDAVFPIASITNTLTAIAVMQLPGARADRPCSRQQLPARLPVVPGEGELPARDGGRSAGPHGRSSSDAAPGRPVLFGRAREGR